MVDTTGPWAWLRAGPGEQYRVIGEIEDKSLLRCFPQTRTENDWVWVEQSWRAGWLAAFVVDFEPIDEVPGQPEHAQTPYDGRVALWHWKGQVLPHNSIDEVAQHLKRMAPRVTEVFVKVCDSTLESGADWQGRWDSNAGLAVTGPERIDRWVSALGRYGMNFHAWCVARDLDAEAETGLIVQACRRPGVRSLILDVEPYEGFWTGGREGIRPYMLRIRRQLPAGFHIGMSVDPRRHHYGSIWPAEWRPFVNSVHPQVYWAIFGVLPEVALKEAWQVWGDYGLPVIPVLQGDAEAREMRAAHNLSTQRHGAPGVSWWRLGVIGEAQYRALDHPIGTVEENDQNSPPETGGMAMVRPDDPGFARGSYRGGEAFRSFRGAMGWPVWCRPTQTAGAATWVSWSPALRGGATCELAAFVPEQHATTRSASYSIQGVRGAAFPVTVELDQSRHGNQWVTLGVFSLAAGESGAGSVFATDLTGEEEREIAFDALRWRILSDDVPSGVDGHNGGLADGYDAPVGTAAERRSSQLLAGQWSARDSFGQFTQRPGMAEGYSPGIDLSLDDAQGNRAVYSCAAGVVTFVGDLPGAGTTVVIRHDPLRGSGRVLFSRYCHVEKVQARIGDRVRRGEQIARAARVAGGSGCRVYFDLCATAALDRQPGHWPGRNYLALMRNYVDPLDFIAGHRPGDATVSG